MPLTGLSSKCSRSALSARAAQSRISLCGGYWAVCLQAASGLEIEDSYGSPTGFKSAASDPKSVVYIRPIQRLIPPKAAMRVRRRETPSLTTSVGI